MARGRCARLRAFDIPQQYRRAWPCVSVSAHSDNEKSCSDLNDCCLPAVARACSTIVANVALVATKRTAVGRIGHHRTGSSRIQTCEYPRNLRPLPATAAVVRWRLVRREGDRRDRRQHPGLHLQIIVLALPRHFFLMRLEFADALPDFVAL
jgi:hypothetical protein